ncbi:MAG: hypothetical protein KAR39_03530 [Thermoplasmata archaeon]|nr:hypothetical protein [Thermoplasmata archaeon]
MIRQLIAKLLRSTGCSVSLEGDVLTASRGDARLTFGFPSENSLQDVLDQIAGKGGQGVLVPMLDEPIEAPGIIILDREDLENDVMQVLLGKKKTRETVLGDLVTDCLGEMDKVPEAMVRPTLEKEDVVEIGNKMVDGFNYILDLVPYFVFEYTSLVEYDGEVQESKGTIGVNALTESPEIWEHDMERMDGIEYFDRKREPKTDEVEAFQIAQRKVIELGTVVKESVKEREDATIQQKKSVKPKKEDVQLEGLGLVYLPIWCVEGSKGSIIINASTGKILKEDLYS